MNRLLLTTIFFLANNILFSNPPISGAQTTGNELFSIRKINLRDIPQEYNINNDINVDLKTENGIDIGDFNINKDGEIEVYFKSGKGISTDIEI
ncbi:hypothetical protein [Paraclostridium bifermentans]|uniref:hypothetical protein n=1 Tax=Paraclostridium bifermentans TaxID=1490 RepID=UPI00359C3E0F